MDLEWEVKAVTSTQFKHALSLQMVQFKAWNKKYPGDAMMRGATQQNKHRRGGEVEEGSIVKCKDNTVRVSYEQ